MVRTTLAAVMLTAITSSAFGLNLLADPGFEGALTYDGAPFVGSWEGFLSGADAFSETTTSAPRTGAQSLELQIFGVANQFAGVFQDVPNLLPGETGQLGRLSPQYRPGQRRHRNPHRMARLGQ
jgi:hypothetical protein